MQGFDSPAGSPQEWGFTIMNTTNYRLEKGDTVRVAGCHGMLFDCDGEKLELADGVKLGVECILEASQDADLEVKLPAGILGYHKSYIHMACVELVKKGEPKSATIENNPNCELLKVYVDTEDERLLAEIWYDYIPKEVAEKCASIIKEAYDTLALNRKEQE